MAVPDLVPILQLAVGPVIVISGVGLVLLSITNRFGRVIDRSRILSDLLHKTPEDPGNRYYSQLKIMFRRARLLRLCITLASMSLLLAALLIISLFVLSLCRLQLGGLIVGLFIACMLTLIASLLVFIIDVNVSLKALAFEIDLHDKEV